VLTAPPAARSIGVQHAARDPDAEALDQPKHVAVAKIVIRARQHFEVIVPEGDPLLLAVLRYPDELRDPGELDAPGAPGVTKWSTSSPC
jgi:hypothetical protein